MSYTVSLPDLRGFADLVGSLEEFFRGLKEVLKESYYTEVVMADLMNDRNLLDGGPLGGALSGFVREFVELMAADEAACERLGSGLAEVATYLRATAKSYEASDADAQAELDAAGPSDENQEIVDSITGGDPNSDWSARLMAATHTVPQDPMKYRRMGYEDEVMEADEALETVLSGDVFASINDVFHYLTGWNPAKEATRPLLGDWGFLYFMGEVFSRASDAANEAARLLSTSTATLVAADWTGDAATAFANYSTSYQSVLTALADHFDRASATMSEMAAVMDKAGEQVGTLLITAADTALDLYSRNPAKFFRNVLDLILSGDFLDLINPVTEGLDGLVTVLSTASSSTDGLTAEADALAPPRRQS